MNQSLNFYTEKRLDIFKTKSLCLIGLLLPAYRCNTLMSCFREFLLFYCAVLITNSLVYSNVHVVLELARPQLTSLRVVLVLPHHLETLRLTNVSKLLI